jgi:hypothetical protein
MLSNVFESYGFAMIAIIYHRHNFSTLIIFQSYVIAYDLSCRNCGAWRNPGLSLPFFANQEFSRYQQPSDFSKNGSAFLAQPLTIIPWL